MAVSIGKVLEVSGEVIVRNAETGETRKLGVDGELFPNERVLTSESGAISIQLLDGNVLTLGRDSQIALDDDVIPASSISSLSDTQAQSVENLLRAVEEGRFDELDQTGDELPEEIARIIEDRAKALAEEKAEEEELSSSQAGADQLARTAAEGEVTSGFETILQQQIEALEVEEEDDEEESDEPVYQGTLTLTGSEVVIEGEQAVYVLTLDNPPLETFTVEVQVVFLGADASDIDTTTQTITFEPGQLQASFNIGAVDDVYKETGEAFQVEVVSTSGGSFSVQPDIPAPVITQIVDESAPPEAGVDERDTAVVTLTGPAQIIEGETQLYTISLSDPTAEDMFLKVTTQHIDTETGDFVALDQVIIIPAGESEATFELETIDDEYLEGNEAFTISVSDILGGGYEKLPDPPAPLEVVIVDETDPAEIDVTELTLSGDSQVVEGDEAHYQLQLTSASTADIEVAVRVSHLDTDNADVLAETQVLTFPAGTDVFDFSIATFEDFDYEADEKYQVEIISVAGNGGFEKLVFDGSPITTTILNDDPNAVDDVNSVTEDDVLTANGNVISNDDLGYDTTDTPIIGLQAGVAEDISGNVGTSVQGQYGSMLIFPDGSYLYTLDNSLPEVQGLNNNDTLLDIFSYTLADGDGDTSSAQIGITIHGNNNDLPSIIIPDQTFSVSEAGLDVFGSDGSSDSETTSLYFNVEAIDGLSTLRVGPETFTLNQLEAASVLNPLTVVLDYGQLEIVNYDVNTGEVTGKYELQTAVDSEVIEKEVIDLLATDTDGDTNAAQLEINLIDDVVTTTADTDTATEDGGSINGNVVSNDVIGADQTATPVTGVKTGTDTNTEATGNVGSSLAGSYGSLTLNNDGTYSYAVDNTNLEVQGITTGETLTESFVYTVTDADGDTSTNTLTITINGQDDGVSLTIPDNDAGHSTEQVVYESALSTGSDASSDGEGFNSSFTIQALDTLDKITVGGTDISKSALESSATTPISIDTGEGTLIVNNYSLDANGVGTVSYSYELKSNVDHSGGDVTDSIAVSVFDTDGDNTSDSIDIRIVDDAPIAVNDTPQTLAEGDQQVSGNVISANDVPGADGSVQLYEVAYTDSSGNAQTYRFNDDADHSFDTPTGTLTISRDGDWSFESTSQFDHDENSLVGSFSYNLIDGDGSISNSANQQITVSDTTLTVNAVQQSLSEADSTAGSNLTGTAAKIANVSLGIQQANDSIESIYFDLADINTALGGLTSAGEPLIFSVSTSDTQDDTLSALNAAGDVIFEVFLKVNENDPATSVYDFHLIGALDHINTDSLAVNVPFSINETDETVKSQIALNVTDDAPIGVDETVAESVTEGNVDLDTQTDNLLSNEISGADRGLHIVTFDYTDNNGQSQTASAGETVQAEYGSLTVNADGTWSYQSYSSVDNSNGDPEETFSYTFEDGDGDQASASQSITVLDGADPLIQDPQDASTDEKYLENGSDPDITALSVSGVMGVQKGTDDIDTTFDQDQPGLVENGVSKFTSGGDDIVFTVSADGHTLTAYTNDINQPVFDVVITNADNNNATYTFTLHQPVDHVNGEDIPFPFNFTVTDTDGDSANSHFEVTVVDDVPDTTKSIDVDEDQSITFNTTADGAGNISLVNNPAHGSVIINPDGTIKYTPNADYSGSDEFTYRTANEDGSFTDTTVSASVAPKADAADLSVDQSEVTTDEDVSVAIGFNAPQLNDQVDHSTNVDEDNPERLGAISLTGFPDGAKLLDANGNELASFGAGVDEISIELTDINHIGNLAADLEMTIADFEGLKVVPPFNDADNFTLTMSTNSYEVGDDNLPLAGVQPAASNIEVEIDVLAVTDVPSLSLQGGISQFTIDEDTTLDLTSNLVESFVDIDASEQVWYEVSGLEPGSKVTIGSDTYTADNNGYVSSETNKISVDEAGENPSFQVRPAHNFSGDLEGITITLNSQDTDADSTVTTAVESSSVTIDLYVNPISDNVNLEDPDPIDEDHSVAFLSKLSIQDTDSAVSETITEVVVNNLQTGWVLADHQGNAVLTGDGSSDYTIDVSSIGLEDLKQFTLTPPAHSSKDEIVSVSITTEDTNTVDGQVVTSSQTWDHDVGIEVHAVSETLTDDTDGDSQLDVIRSPDVDTDAGTLGAEDGGFFDLSVPGNVLSISNEDSSEQSWAIVSLSDDLSVADIRALDGTQIRYDSDPGVGENWVVASLDRGSDEVMVPAAYLETLQFQPPQNFSGEVKLDIQVKTQDFDEDDQSEAAAYISDAVTLTFDVTAVADNVTGSVQQAIGLEDQGRDANHQITNNGADGIILKVGLSSDDTDSSEYQTLVIHDIPDGAYIHYNGELIQLTDAVIDNNTSGRFENSDEFVMTPEDTDSNDGVWTLTIENYQGTDQLFIIPPENSNDDFVLKIDALTTERDNPTATRSLESDIDLPVKVKGVADQMVADSLVEDPSVAGYQQVLTEAGFEANGLMVKEAFADLINLDTYDQDGSETVTVVITGVGSQFDIEGAQSAGGSGEDRKWVVTLEEFKSEAINLVGPDHFSGEVNYIVQMVTTETDGDTQTNEYQIQNLITPTTEATLSTSSTTVVEDEFTAVNLTLNDQGDSSESISQVWLSQADVEGQAFELYLDAAGAQKLTDVLTADGGYYKLSPEQAGSVFAKFGDQVGTAQPETIQGKYQTADSVSVDGTVYTDTSALQDFTYTLTNSAVTDSADIEFMSQGQAVSSIDVTANGTMDFVIQIDSADKDSSETVTKLVLSGVPNGVVIEGADYIGETTDDGSTTDASGVWEISDLENWTSLDADGASYQLTLDVFGAFDENDQLSITATAYTQDHEATELTTSTNLTLNITQDLAGNNDAEPLHIDSLEIDDQFTPVEDTVFTLADVVSATVTQNAVNAIDDEGWFAITLQGLENCTVSGMEYSVEAGVWTLQGEISLQPGQTDYSQEINDIFASIQIVPDKNFNANSGDTLDFDMVLTTYAEQGPREAMVASVSKDVTPVTDGLNVKEELTYFDADNNLSTEALEDGTTQISIDLESAQNSPDYSWTVLSSEITLTHSGISGELSWDGGSQLLNEGDTVTLPVSALSQPLVFTPDENDSGTVNFSYSVETQEQGAANVVTKSQSFEFDVKPVADGFDVDPSGVHASADEDQLMAITFDDPNNPGQTVDLSDSALLPDSDSETLELIVLNNVPDGFLVFVGDAGSQELALNLGNNGTAGLNQWSISLESGVPNLWLKAPDNWSGDVAGLTLSTTVTDTSNTTTVTSQLDTVFDAHWDPVADSVTIHPSKTFGDEAEMIPLNMNLGMTDYDGSETVTLTFEGLTREGQNFDFDNGGWVFKVPDVANPGQFIDFTGQSFANGVYTLEGLTMGQVYGLHVQAPQGDKGIYQLEVTAQSQDGSDLGDVVGADGSKVFSLDISSQASGTTTYTATAGSEVDTAISGKTVVSSGYHIPLTLNGLDLVDKVTDLGEEMLTLKLSDLGDALTPELSQAAIDAGVTLEQDGEDWLIHVGSAGDASFSAAVAAINSHGGIVLNTNSVNSSVEVNSISVAAYSTNLDTREQSSENTVSVLLNLKVDPDGNLSGTVNDDLLVGSAEAETLVGDAGDDTLQGLAGDDTLEGGSGHDFLYGDDGLDILSGGSGDDFLQGDLGDDTLHGGDDDDTLHGGEGNDILYGGDGFDELTGGAGADTFVVSSDTDNVDKITDFDVDNDILDLSEVLTGVTLDAENLDEYLTLSDTAFGSELTIDTNGKSNDSAADIVTINLENTHVNSVEELHIIDD